VAIRVLKRSTVIWACPKCDHWEWGSIREPPDTCPVCGSDMSGSEPDRQAAIDTYYCNRYHDRYV
jgi:rRNA maturation protein Nop10